MTPRRGIAHRTVAAIAQGANDIGETLADWLASIVNGIKALVPMTALGLGLAVGCEGGEAVKSMPEPPTAAIARVVPSAVPVDAGVTPEDAGPRPLGNFNITFYYVIGEDEVVPKPVATAKPPTPANDNHTEVAMAPDGDHESAPADPLATPPATAEAAPPAPAGDDNLAAVATPAQVTLYTDECTAITDVLPEFASQLALQGTGKLRDGRVLNISSNCRCQHSPCFKVTENQWGMAGTGRPLQPFRTVAVDPKVVKLGSLLYVPLLDGRTMPGRAPWGGYVHDGCVVADDTGGGIDGNQLDLFVGRKAYFLGLSGHEGSHSWAKKVPVFDGSGICARKGREVGRKVAAI